MNTATARTAIYALTRDGALLGNTLAQALDARLFIPARLAGADLQEHGAFERLATFVAESFTEYDQHVFVAAAGIVVRTIAPLLKGKAQDPAVVVTDQHGRFAVSLLSGHLGGANDLAHTVADLTEGQAVITTATDTEGLPSLDVLARDRGLGIANLEMVKVVNAALLEGREIQILDPGDHLLLRPGPEGPQAYDGLFRLVETMDQWREGEPGVLVTPLTNAAPEETLILHPPVLAVGVGCRRGTPTEAVLEAVTGTLAQANLARQSILALTSITAKSDERGILETAARLGVGLAFYEPEVLGRIKTPNPSETVRKHMGVAGVCEAAAMQCARAKTLIVEKQKCNGVTIAVAQAG